MPAAFALDRPSPSRRSNRGESLDGRITSISTSLSVVRAAGERVDFYRALGYLDDHTVSIGERLIADD